MPRRSARLATSLRTCPLCSSLAVTEVRTHELGCVRRRCVVRCGDCGTWRGTVLGLRDARALEKGFARKLRGDRRELARVIRELAAPGLIMMDPRSR